MSEWKKTTTGSNKDLLCVKCHLPLQHILKLIFIMLIEFIIQIELLY